MCTAFGLYNGSSFMGRNLDLDYDFNQEIVLTPENYPLSFKKVDTLSHHYPILGMAMVAENYPLYAEAMNNQGLAMAGLNFPKFAYFPQDLEKDTINITPYEIIPFVLSQCKNIDEARSLLEKIRIVSIPFTEKIGISPLHWFLTDGKQALVIESTKDGLSLSLNPAKVLTNAPSIDFHLMNLQQYMGLSSEEPKEGFASYIKAPLSKGQGQLGIPGDSSSISRFIRCAYTLSQVEKRKNIPHPIAECFHILDIVKTVAGTVKTEIDWEYTRYSSCLDLDNFTYYCKTYEDIGIKKVSISETLQKESTLQIL